MTPIEDLPADVATLLEKFEEDAAALHDRFGEEIQKIQETADQEIGMIRRKSEQKIQLKAISLIDQIKPLQAAFLKEGKLDEALAIRDAIRQLRSLGINARPAPGNLVAYQDKVNQQFLFEVIGATQGPLWGSDIYTLDSSLACTAVHAGAVAIGQKGAVRVVIQDTSAMSIFDGTQRNGANSFPWGSYPIGFRVSRA